MLQQELLDNTKQNRPLMGIALMVSGMLVIPLLDVYAKILSETYPNMQVVWGRFMFHLLWMLPIVMWKKYNWWKLPEHAGLQIIRSLCLLLATIFFFWSIRENPIPQALALLFVSPLVVTLASPILLGESFGMKRFIATIVGFIGILIVLRPTTDALNMTLLLALVSGFCYAFYIITTRRLSGNAPPILTLFYTAIVGAAVLSFVMPSVWIPPDMDGWLMMVLMGLVAAVGHLLIIMACEYAPASIIAPFNYTEIIGATLFSYLMFDYLPDIWVWTGIMIICGSGIYISYRELKVRQ